MVSNFARTGLLALRIGRGFLFICKILDLFARIQKVLSERLADAI
jgi:hypothetical protein